MPSPSRTQTAVGFASPSTRSFLSCAAQVSDLQKKIAAAVSRLKQQQNLYEAVRSDRNVYSKNLIETQDVIKEMKQRFKIMNHQIEQLKDEITVMDHSLVSVPATV